MYNISTNYVSLRVFFSYLFVISSQLLIYSCRYKLNLDIVQGTSNFDDVRAEMCSNIYMDYDVHFWDQI